MARADGSPMAAPLYHISPSAASFSVTGFCFGLICWEVIGDVKAQRSLGQLEALACVAEQLRPEGLF